MAPAASSRPDAAVTYQMQTDPGDSSGEATPVPIPNTEVKLSSAEDTERAAFRENRSSPGSLRFRAFAILLSADGAADASEPADNRCVPVARASTSVAPMVPPGFRRDVSC